MSGRGRGRARARMGAWAGWWCGGCSERGAGSTVAAEPGASSAGERGTPRAGREKQIKMGKACVF